MLDIERYKILFAKMNTLKKSLTCQKKLRHFGRMGAIEQIDFPDVPKYVF